MKKLRVVKYIPFGEMGHSGEKEYHCQKEWADDVSLQCGSKGVVLKKEGGYTTAFFEIFISGTYLRGEGKTIEDAETNVYEKYRPMLECKDHHFEQVGRQDRDGVCSHCGFIKKECFKPSHECSVCYKPHVMLKIDNDHFCIHHFIEKSKSMDLSITPERIQKIKQDLFETISKKAENKEFNIIELCSGNDKIKKIEDIKDDHFEVEFKVDSIKEQKEKFKLYSVLEKSGAIEKMLESHEEFELVEFIDNLKSNSFSVIYKTIIKVINDRIKILAKKIENQETPKSDIFYFNVLDKITDENPVSQKRIMDKISNFMFLQLLDKEIKKVFSLDGFDFIYIYYGRNQKEMDHEITVDLNKEILESMISVLNETQKGKNNEQ